MRRKPAARLFLFLAVRVLSATEPEIRVDEDSIRPYGVCSGTLRSDEGFSGTVEVRGRLFDGSEVPLFREELAGWTERLEFLFIPDETVRALFVPGSGSERELPRTRTSGRDAEGARLLDSLAAPFRFSASVPPSRGTRIPARNPGAAGMAAARIFAQPRDIRILGILAAYALVSLFLAAFRDKADKAGLPLLIVLSLSGSLAVAFLGPSDSTLFRLTLSDTRGPYSLSARPEVRRLAGYTLVSFGEDPTAAHGEDPKLAILGIRAPGNRPLPLAAFPRGTLLKFRDPPLVIHRADDGYFLVFKDFAMGWALYD